MLALFQCERSRTFGHGAAQVMFIVERKAEVTPIAPQNGHAVDEGETEGQEMPEDQPAALPPRHGAEGAPVAPSGRVAVSPFTASPEQLRAEPPAVSDDIYGLGALAYELLSGYPPYYPNFDFRRALEEPVPELRPVYQAPPGLIELVMGMLAKLPAR